MRKKYLSALLFGALLFASAGTFTSCKDYDDDINGLREDVTSLQNAVTTLQNAVENGKYVSAVSNNGNTITFTFTDGTTTDITLEDEKGSVVTVNADGVLCIDGEPTDIKAATDPTPGEEQKDQIIIENNMWSVLQEDGTYKSTGIPVSGINVAGSEADGYTFTIYAADGSSQTVKLPSAVSSITEMTLGTKTIQPEGATFKYSDGYLTEGTEGVDVDPQEKGVLISHQDFNFNPSKDVKTDGITSASKWLGNKKLPNNGDFIYASPTQIDLRMDPVDVPAENINFYLTNTLNKDVEPIVFTASPSQTDGNAMTGSEVNGRAATTGNGLWALSMANQVVAKDDNEDVWDAIKKSEGDTKDAAVVYALNANHGFRSKYQLTVQRINPEELTGFSIKGIEEKNATDDTFDFDVEENYVTYKGQSSPLKSDYLDGDQAGSDQNITFKTNVEYTVNAVQASALYDMYLTADESDVEVYGLTFNQDKHTFTIGKNPDVSSIPAEFDLIIYSVANNGDVKKTVVTIVLNSEISTPAEYGLHEHDVNVADNNNNYFGIDLATMKTALGDNLNQWMQNVDITKVDFQWSTKADKDFGDMPDGITAMVVEKLSKKDSDDHKAVSDRNKANYIQVDVANKEVDGLDLDKTYYIKATFVATTENGGGTLNSIVVPVEFHAPALADLFSKKDAYVDKTDGVIGAYFYQTNKGDNKPAPTAVTLARYFNDFVSNAQVTFTNDKVGETGETGETLFELKYTKDGGTNTINSSTENAVVYFGKDNSVEGSTEKVYTTLDFDSKKPGRNGKNQGQNGYKEVVTIKATKSYFNTDETVAHGWDYAEDSDKEYSFQIRLMSPIYEGSVNPVSGNTINISANDWSNGARITDAMIKGADYNKNTYNVVPDALKTENGTYVAAWDNKQIDKVTPERDDQHLIKTIGLDPATYDADSKTKYNGAIVVKGENILNTTEVQMPITVTDVWGYELKEEVSVTIQMND